MQQQVYDTRQGRNSERKSIQQEAAESRTENVLTTDHVFEVLYNRRRRDVITYLREHGGTATTSDLAEYIAAKENETTVEGLSSGERKRVYVGLYQNHLPMMDDVGVVNYDKDRGTVELQECAAQLLPYLDDETETNAHRMTAGGAVGLAGFLLLGVFDVGVFAAISDLLWVTLGVIGLFVLALGDEYDLFAAADR
ncbi:DUF7344 domain-containing protein [Halobellus ordinarius]|uniref:DUF7344 domain-containing protein n=1 Tax=Halobellus ordinarius TaxID=3075120 RepID=UPI0028808ABB|nr:hypothetical protein [Halobellus sp. ZY16]